MSLRPTDVLDRAATLLAGLVVVAIGAVAVLWPTHLIRGIPEHISTTQLMRLTTSSWWPWELGGVGAMLVLAGLVWLISHIPTHTAPMLRVPGTTGPGFIAINLTGVASAAAAALNRQPDVQVAKGKALIERGTITVELTVTVAHPAGLANMLDQIDSTCGHIAKATAGGGTPAVAARTILQVAKTGNTSRKPRNLQ